MNRLLTFSGLQPIYLGDIDFLQDSVKEAFLLLLKGLTGENEPNCILVDATKEHDGVICLNGEILPLKAATGSILSAIGYRVVSTFSGGRRFKDGEEHDCHETRYAQAYYITNVGVARLPDLTSLLMSRFKTTTGAISFEPDDTIAARRLVRFSKFSDLILFEIDLTFTEESTVTNVFTNELLAIPRVKVGQGYKYTTLVAEIESSLVNIPAKITFATNEGQPSDSYITVKIPSTKFSAGSTGTISLMLVVNEL